MIIELVCLCVVYPLMLLVIVLHIRSGFTRYLYIMGFFTGLALTHFVYSSVYKNTETEACSRVIPDNSRLTNATPLPRFWSIPGHRALLCRYAQPSGSTGVVLLHQMDLLGGAK